MIYLHICCLRGWFLFPLWYLYLISASLLCTGWKLSSFSFLLEYLTSWCSHSMLDVDLKEICAKMTFMYPRRRIWATLLSNLNETHAGLDRTDDILDCNVDVMCFMAPEKLNDSVPLPKVLAFILFLEQHWISFTITG